MIRSHAELSSNAVPTPEADANASAAELGRISTELSANGSEFDNSIYPVEVVAYPNIWLLPWQRDSGRYVMVMSEFEMDENGAHVAFSGAYSSLHTYLCDELKMDDYGFMPVRIGNHDYKISASVCATKRDSIQHPWIGWTVDGDIPQLQPELPKLMEIVNKSREELEPVLKTKMGHDMAEIRQEVILVNPRARPGEDRIVFLEGEDLIRP